MTACWHWRQSLVGRVVSQCEHGGLVAHAYIADPDGYVVEIQYGSGELPVIRNKEET